MGNIPQNEVKCIRKRLVMVNVNRPIDIMGIVNITDNSYFGESRCLSEDGSADIPAVISRVTKMIQHGATIIDIGACSTKPGSEPVGKDEEIKRLIPAINAIRAEFPEIPISVDTYWSEVVKRAYDTIGDIIVNDISAGEDDPKMLKTVAKLGLTYVAMHKRGDSKTMQAMTDYDNVTDEVLKYFRAFSRKAEEVGIDNWILDPGFGFAKTIDQNYELLKDLEQFQSIGQKILIGVSRKSMLYRLFETTPEDTLPETQVLHLAALQKGADILRVHDVQSAARTIELYRRIC